MESIVTQGKNAVKNRMVSHVNRRNAPDGRLVFLLGVPYSGSTALGNWANNTRPSSYAGELERLPQFARHYSGPVPQAECLVCSYRGQECALWGRESVNSLAGLNTRELFRELLKRGDNSVIIEGSKSPSFLQQFGLPLTDTFDVRVIITTRNPISSMSSYISAGKKLGQEIEPWQAANFWRDTYAHALSVVNNAHLPMLVFASEALRANTVEDLENATRVLRNFIGFDEPSHRATTLPGVAQMFSATHQYGGNGGVQGGPGLGSAASSELRRESFVQLADAFANCPGATQIASLLGINVRAILSAPADV